MSIKNRLNIITLESELAILFIASLFLFLNCTDDDENKLSKSVVSKNIILYIEGNNNLNNFSDSIVYKIMNDSMIQSIHNVSLSIVYDDIDSTKIIDVSEGTRISYPKLNGLDGKILNKLICHCINSHPAKEYGIVFWSHGSGWIRTNLTRSFGYDNGKDINIDDLSNNLPIKFDYIIFDACYMSCIEVVTELKNKADYIIASPEEVPSDGIIDTQSIYYLMTDSCLLTRLVQLCNYYKNKFKNYKEEVSLALINTNSIINLMNEIKNHKAIKINNTHTRN